MFMGFEEVDGDEEMREEFPCSFCPEYFDSVGLCCHIDEDHPLEAKIGTCPVCAFRMQRRRRLHKTVSHSTLSMVKNELREGKLQALFGSSCSFPSSNTPPDPLLSSFIFPMADASQPQTSKSMSSSYKIPSERTIERSVRPSTSSLKAKEAVKRSEFFHGLLLSTIVDENL